MNPDFKAYLGVAGQDFNKYAAGTRRYGGGRDAPNIGPVDPVGYRERDALARRKRNAMLRRMQAQQADRLMSPENLSPDARSY